MLVIKKRSNNLFIYIFIILLAVSPAFALGDGNRNLLLIGAMYVAPIFFLFYPEVHIRTDIPLLSLCLMMIIFPLLFHPETLRWSTVLYSCLFCAFFMVFVRVLYHSRFSVVDFMSILKWLLYAYCVVLLIQQFCVLVGLPIFNVSSYNPLEPWKLNSLMSEPSRSARVIPILMYMFISLKMKFFGENTLIESFKKNKWVWISFFWPTLTMGSATALIFMLIVFAKFINIRKLLPTLLCVIVLVLAFVLFSENKSVDRVRRVVSAVITLDEDSIIQADHSASFRIVPTIQGAKQVGISTNNDWFGYGIDADQDMIEPLPSVAKGGAGAFYLWINFGLIVAFTFWIFTFRICYLKSDQVSILIWFLGIFIYGGLNMQIIWLVLILMYVYKKLSNNKHINQNYENHSYYSW